MGEVCHVTMLTIYATQELKAVQVIDGNKLVPKKRGITLRMLLSHTGKQSAMRAMSSRLTSTPQPASATPSSTHVSTTIMAPSASMSSLATPMTIYRSPSSTSLESDGSTASISTGLGNWSSASQECRSMATSRNTSSSPWASRTSTCFRRSI